MKDYYSVIREIIYFIQFLCIKSNIYFKFQRFNSIFHIFPSIHHLSLKRKKLCKIFTLRSNDTLYLRYHLSNPKKWSFWREENTKWTFQKASFIRLVIFSLVIESYLPSWGQDSPGRACSFRSFISTGDQQRSYVASEMILPFQRPWFMFARERREWQMKNATRYEISPPHGINLQQRDEKGRWTCSDLIARYWCRLMKFFLSIVLNNGS